MVLLTYKRTEKDAFSYQCKTTDEVDDVATAIVHIHNLRVRLRYCIVLATDLAKNAPPDVAGRIQAAMDKIQAVLTTSEPVVAEPFEAAYDELVGTLKIAYTAIASDAGETQDSIQAAIGRVEAADMPEDERIMKKTVLMILAARDVSMTPEARETFDEETAVLWFCGKSMPRERRIMDILGKNETTKAVVKIGKHGAGAPARDAPVDDETQRAMMAYYFKKQEELKRIQEDEDISYGSQPWANPRGLKDHFQGIGTIRPR